MDPQPQQQPQPQLQEDQHPDNPPQQQSQDSSAKQQQKMEEQNSGPPQIKEVSPQKLQQLFKKYDTDNTGRLKATQIIKILKDELNQDFYEGDVSWTIRLMNYNVQGVDWDDYTINFDQFLSYFNVRKNSFKKQLFEKKYKMLEEVEKIKIDYLGAGQQEEVAPTHKVPQIKSTDPSFKGDIQITIGPEDYNYNSYAKVTLQKQPKRCEFATARATLYQDSPQQSTQLCQRLLHLQKQLKDLLISKDPDMEQFFNQLIFTAKTQGSKLLLQLKVMNKQANDIIDTGLELVEELLGEKVDIFAQAEIKFDYFVEKFMNPQLTYNFPHCFTKNLYLHLIWNAFNFKQATKTIASSCLTFFDKKIDDPLYPVFVAFLHAKNCKAKFYFDNSDLFQMKIQKSIKQYVLRKIAKLHRFLMEYERGQLALQAVKLFKNQFDFEIQAGEWRVFGHLKIKDCNQMLSEEFVKNLSE